MQHYAPFKPVHYGPSNARAIRGMPGKLVLANGNGNDGTKGNSFAVPGKTNVNGTRKLVFSTSDPFFKDPRASVVLFPPPGFYPRLFSPADELSANEPKPRLTGTNADTSPAALKLRQMVSNAESRLGVLAAQLDVALRMSEPLDGELARIAGKAQEEFDAVFQYAKKNKRIGQLPTSLFNAALNIYAKLGQPGKAQGIFHHIPDAVTSDATYALMITAHGNAAKIAYLEGVALWSEKQTGKADAKFDEEARRIKSAKNIYKRAASNGAAGERAVLAISRLYEDLIELRSRHELPESVLGLLESAIANGFPNENLLQLVRGQQEDFNQRIDELLSSGQRGEAIDLSHRAIALGLPVTSL
ncbi:Uncharacterised protein [Candidatus Burarchaeum australiense]|nr:Uncharacterised protein [Candidatus Burarchaeum australiense]